MNILPFFNSPEQDASSNELMAAFNRIQAAYLSATASIDFEFGSDLDSPSMEFTPGAMDSSTQPDKGVHYQNLPTQKIVESVTQEEQQRADYIAYLDQVAKGEAL